MQPPVGFRPPDPNAAFDPYRAPTGGAFEGDGRSRRKWAASAVLAGGLVMVLGVFGGMGTVVASALLYPESRDIPALGVVGIVAMGVGMLTMYVVFGFGIAWVHGCYAWLPHDKRVPATWGKPVPPVMAALLLAVPYFNYYWMFAVHAGLCNALDQMKVAYPTDRAAGAWQPVTASTA
jgi:hypothetical protein